ncbi:hypothetical protein SAMN05443637_116124 [Pseudonocardia thermophila]|jgi:hypothetical protein|uniref:Uncharacterized protein n=1 Tax=Pseudonocardia thermophila TaxID=1848 RepID=A0A1M6X9S4_PSETH|nr:hypothetical protein [Pseudonocardia thermophila]SHL02683.1 hypothetical protein SAMN05443637_116124 [Pseudonocardia thermophila]
MPDRVLMLPAPARPRHRRHPVRTAVLDTVAKVGSGVTIAAIFVVAGTAATLTAEPVDPPARVVTFELSR